MEWKDFTVEELRVNMTRAANWKSPGCKDQLMINNAILENCKKRKKNLSTAWMDYNKAFDSVPHSWILKCLQMYKINPVLITFIEESVSQ